MIRPGPARDDREVRGVAVVLLKFNAAAADDQHPGHTYLYCSVLTTTSGALTLTLRAIVCAHVPLPCAGAVVTCHVMPCPPALSPLPRACSRHR